MIPYLKTNKILYQISSTPKEPGYSGKDLGKVSNNKTQSKGGISREILREGRSTEFKCGYKETKLGIILNNLKCQVRKS